MKIELINKKGDKLKNFDLPEELFAVEWNPQLVHDAVFIYRSNLREGNAHAKERGDVSGGGKKPWRQKGTGRARHGSIRSPLWRGGGVTFGPNNERNYKKKINKKAKRKALFSVLSKKYSDGEIMLVDTLALEENKTKEVKSLINSLFGEKKTRGSILFVPTSGNKDFYKAAKNIDKVSALSPLSLNIYDVLKFKFVIIDKDSLPEIIDQYKLS